MQLIVEPEATLDIEMSAVQNIQNNVENLDTDGFKNKRNGNKEVLEEKDDGKKEMFSEIEATLANMHADIDSNNAQLSNIDLSEIISEQNSHGNKDVQIQESQINSLENDTNGLNDDKKENLEESKDIQEEDYLEDDIISISEEPFKEILQLHTESTDEVIKKSETSAAETILIDEEDKKETLQIECQLSTEDKDIIEVLDETENTTIHEKKTELQVQVEKEEVEVMEKPEITSTQCESEKQSQLHKDDDEIEIIEESEDASFQCDKESETIVEESNTIEVILDTFNSCGNNTNAPKEELKQNSIEITEEIEAISTEYENKADLPEEEKKDQVEIIEDIEDNQSQSESNIDSAIEAENNERKELDLPTKEKDVIELIEESEKHSILSENKSDLPKDTEITADAIKSLENQEMHTGDATNSSKCDTVEITNSNAADSPIALKDSAMEIEEAKSPSKSNNAAIEFKDDIEMYMDVEEVPDKIANNNKVFSIVKDADINTVPVNTAPIKITIDKPIICKLSNTLDILSDDEEEELPKAYVKSVSPKVSEAKENQSINLEDDDDIMLIDEDTNKTEPNVPVEDKVKKETVVQPENDKETSEEAVEKNTNAIVKNEEKESTPPAAETKNATVETDIKEEKPDASSVKVESPAPLISDNFVKTVFKKKLSDMTRDELEEFCILKIVESIVDRGSLTDIKNKLISMTHALDEHRKKTLMLTKQNRDLQVVLKSVQEEQKKATDNKFITPLKITRSVGMQVFMEKAAPRKKGQQQNMNNKNVQNKNMTQAQGPRAQKLNQNIPVPRLVPANNPALKTPNNVPQVNQMNTPGKTNPANGIVKTPSPVNKAEKRQFNKIGSVTVDLTDDEPPAKVAGGPKTSPAPPVRLIPPQNLMAPRFGTSVNSPRKVYIPISGPQNQGLRPGQTIMLKTVPASGVRPRCSTPQVTRMETNSVRFSRIAPRHPAPLPLAMKQYQPPNWKSLPPPPDLKLSKVENGIVISWKIEDVPEDSYEEIASYQLYAYQETSLPPSTALWKKIGDVKALPLPMACTLTQFMAGFKYYFAVRAVDIRSRIGPFSLPGSILLLSKNM